MNLANIFLKSHELKSGLNSSGFDYYDASKAITDFATRGLSLSEFITESMKIISKFARARKVEIEFEEDGKFYFSRGRWERKKVFNLEFRQKGSDEKSDFSELGKKVTDRTDKEINCFVYPLVLGKKTFGYISFTDFFGRKSAKSVESINNLVQSFVLALAYRKTQVALRERVKELSCLYELAKFSSNPEISIDKIMKSTVDLLPPAWLYPECAGGRIILDEVCYSTVGFKKSDQKLTADIETKGKVRGVVEVHYREKKPKLDEGPFLKEERNLINIIARELSLIIERKEAASEKQKLKGQIMHADRLATIGQLAAGVAHEINEPLANILGFAQLAAKAENMPHQANKDIDKIITASMHAREVIRKLLVFSRQTIPAKDRISINKIIEDGLYFFEARCSKLGIDLIKDFKKDIASITADGAQLNQVLINLVVNAIHATPEGGKITVKTYDNDHGVGFVISDTGIGMQNDIIDKIFLPFFTTKDVDEGTGLGLPVVHGIVTSHGGTIEVESMPGFGSSFDVFLPFKDLKKHRED